MLGTIVVAIVLVVGLRRAKEAHQASAELTAATLVGLTGVLISPVSWIHHGVWIVPASGLLLGDGRERGNGPIGRQYGVDAGSFGARGQGPGGAADLDPSRHHDPLVTQRVVSCSECGGDDRIRTGE